MGGRVIVQWAKVWGQSRSRKAIRGDQIRTSCSAFRRATATSTSGDVENIDNAILDEITDALARGDRVELRGFGAFSTKKRDARTGRNPRTGESVPVESKAVPVFKTGKELRLRLAKAARDA